jgi:hypothetical protein
MCLVETVSTVASATPGTGEATCPERFISDLSELASELLVALEVLIAGYILPVAHTDVVAREVFIEESAGIDQRIKFFWGSGEVLVHFHRELAEVIHGGIRSKRFR